MRKVGGKAKRIIKTLVTASGVVLFWRGAWGLMDLYIHPDNPLASFVISILLGFILLASTHHFFDELL